MLLFWEPADGEGLPEVDAHRAEVAELLARVGEDAWPRLHVMTYRDLLEGWAQSHPEHTAGLRARYEVPVHP